MDSLISALEQLSDAELEPYDPRYWGGRISADEYAQFGAALKTAYEGTFQTDLCIKTCFCGLVFWIFALGEECCFRDCAVDSVIDQYNEALRAKGRGVQLAYKPRVRVNCYPVAHKIVAVIRPI